MSFPSVRVVSLRRVLSHIAAGPQGGGKTLLIDVREPEEFRRGHIPLSHLLPLGRLQPSLACSSPRSFQDEHRFEKPAVDQEIIFYCRSGRRSESACLIAIDEGYENVANYQGSWLEWAREVYNKDGDSFIQDPLLHPIITSQSAIQLLERLKK